jgi:hypothetical protein
MGMVPMQLHITVFLVVNQHDSKRLLISDDPITITSNLHEAQQITPYFIEVKTGAQKS